MSVESPLTDDSSPGPGLRASLEAILLVADEPVPAVLLAQVLERPRNEVAAQLRDLAAEYTEQDRGFELREIAGGWRFYTREDCAPLVERFVSDGQEVRLTQAALETLAVVAYRQPVSRARVSAVRWCCAGWSRRRAPTRRRALSSTAPPGTSWNAWGWRA
jgi:segregation and condensation protein B